MLENGADHPMRDGRASKNIFDAVNADEVWGMAGEAQEIDQSPRAGHMPNIPSPLVPKSRWQCFVRTVGVPLETVAYLLPMPP